MAIKPLNSIAGYSIGEYPSTVIIDANGNITTNSLTSNTKVDFTAAGNVSLGGIGNIKISGGSAGQLISTDGSGNLSFITLSSASLTNGTSNLQVLNSGNITLSAGGTANVLLVTSSGAIVTGTLSVSGNSTVGNLGTSGQVAATGNVSGGNITTGGQVAATGNVSGGNITTGGQVVSSVATGTAPLVVTSTTKVANLNADTVDGYDTDTSATANTVAIRDADGNLTANYFIGDGSQLTGLPSGTALVNGNSNVDIASANGNITVSVTGTSNVAIFTSAGVNVVGTINVSGNASVGNLSTAQVTASSNVTSQQFISNVSTGTAPLVVTSTTKVANLNADTVDGYDTSAISTPSTVAVRDTGGNLTANYFIGNGSQLTGLNTSYISNGTSNVSIPSTDGNVNISSSGTANVVVVTDAGANIFGTVNATGNAVFGNVSASTGVFSTAANTGLVQNGTSNVTLASGGNVSTFIGGNSTAQLTVASAGVNVAGYANVLGNLTAGNVSGSTGIFTTGNITTLNSGLVKNGTSNVTLASNGNVSTYIGGNNTAQFVVASSGVEVAGSLDVAGDANLANVSAAQITATDDIITSANVVTDNIIGKTGALTIASAGTNTDINLKPNGTGNIDANSTFITNVKDPVNAQDAATKGYVDVIAQGLDPKASVAYATASALPAYVYNNGTSGVGATLTGISNGALTVDGQSVSLNQRVLVKNETGSNAPYNGIYVITNAGSGSSAYVLTRATDFDNGSPSGEIPGAFVFVESGATNADTGWVCSTDSPVTVGTTNITFVQFSGAGSYSAGTGLTLSGTQFSISSTSVTAGSYGGGDRVASFTVNSQGQLTEAANVVITANAANLSGTTLSSSVVNSSLTSVGTLSSLTVSGNATVGNLIGALANGNSNVSIPSSNGNINLTVSGTTTVVITSTGANITGTANITGNANVGNIGAETAVFTTGNITTVNSGLIQNSTSNVTIASGGNVSLFVGGNTTARLVATSSGVNVAGTLNVVGNANVGNIGASSGVFTANVSAANISATNGNLTTANVTGNVLVGSTTITSATVTTSAVTSNQTIASFPVTDITGVEFLVKGVDTSGGKYSVSTVQAVTDGTNVDYSTFGGVTLGGYTGTLSVNIVGGYIRLQVTPASSNSTVWTTQYRLI